MNCFLEKSRPLDMCKDVEEDGEVPSEAQKPNLALPGLPPPNHTFAATGRPAAANPLDDREIPKHGPWP